MKKDLLYTIFCFVLSVFLMSCQKSEAPVPGVGVERQNFITHYFMPDTLKVDPGVLDEDDPAYPYFKYEYFVRLAVFLEIGVFHVHHIVGNPWRCEECPRTVHLIEITAQRVEISSGGH